MYSNDTNASIEQTNENAFIGNILNPITNEMNVINSSSINNTSISNNNNNFKNLINSLETYEKDQKRKKRMSFSDKLKL